MTKLLLFKGYEMKNGLHFLQQRKKRIIGLAKIN
jgi:hypothetical protein